MAITPEIAEQSADFDCEINNDPADRIIAATSIVHNAQLVTPDSNLRNSSLIRTIWWHKNRDHFYTQPQASNPQAEQVHWQFRTVFSGFDRCGWSDLFY